MYHYVGSVLKTLLFHLQDYFYATVSSRASNEAGRLASHVLGKNKSFRELFKKNSWISFKKLKIILVSTFYSILGTFCLKSTKLLTTDQLRLHQTPLAIIFQGFCTAFTVTVVDTGNVQSPLYFTSIDNPLLHANKWTVNNRSHLKSLGILQHSLRDPNGENNLACHTHQNLT